MSEIPGELKFTKSHEWVSIGEDGVSLTIGITDHAQDLMGDMVYIELPEVGGSYGSGDDCAVVESVKAASDVYAPVSGEVTEINEGLVDSPETLNSDPYGAGWLFKMILSDKDELEDLMDAAAYEELVESEED